MSGNHRTLRGIRRAAPPQDRDCEALRPTPVPFQRPPNSKYVTITLVPDTLERLRTACGRFGDSVVEKAKWSAVTFWLMKNNDKSLLKHTPAEASRCVHLVVRHEHQVNFPDPSKPDIVSELSTLSTDEQSAVRLIALDTRADCERMKEPYSSSSIRHTYQDFLYFRRQNPRLTLGTTN